MIRFSLQHMLRHWRMSLILLIAMTLTAAFLAGLPAYAEAIAGRGLQQQLASATIPAKNILVAGPPIALDETLSGNIQRVLGDLFAERFVYWPAVYLEDGEQTLYRSDETIQFDEFSDVDIVSFERMEEVVQLVDGRLPQPLPSQADYDHLEAVIGTDTATNLQVSRADVTVLDKFSLEVGDQLRYSNRGRELRVDIVGIVDPVDPTDPIWWRDLTPFSFERLPLDGGNLPETVIPTMIVPTQNMETVFTSAQKNWRLILNTSTISIANLEEVEGQLTQVETRYDTQSVAIDTSLFELLRTFRLNVASARVTLFLLTIQSLIFVLVTLGMISAFMLDRSRSEIVTMAGRGFTSWQITSMFAIQGGFLAFGVAVPLGPLVAYWLLSLWGRATVTAVPSTLNTESWGLAVLAVLFGLLTLVGSVYSTARQNLLDWQRQKARPDHLTSWQRYYLDFFLLVLGGLVYWQLADSGSVASLAVTADAFSSAGLADPILLLGPSLLLIAVAMILLRFIPYLLRLAAWLSKRGEGLVLPFGFSKLARDPAGPSRVLLLISLAAALTLFSSLFTYSLDVRQQEMSHYLTGADMRVQIPIGQTEIDTFASLSGVQYASPVYRNVRSRLANNLSRQMEMLAVDYRSLAQVSRYAPYTSRVTIEEVMLALPQGDSTAVPAVFSHDALPGSVDVGDTITFVVGTQRVDFEVRGKIGQFPSLEPPFYLANLDSLERVVDFTTLSEPWVGQREVWLSVADGQAEEVLQAVDSGEAGLNASLIADAESRKQALASDLVAQEALGAFRLNAFVLVGLSVVVFILVNYFAAQQRTREFSVLRANGLSTRQLFSLLSLEGSIMMGVGLLVGSGIGYGLAQVMRPFLSRTLRTAVGGDQLPLILVNGWQVGGLYTVLIGFYILALLLLLLALVRTGIHRALRLGEE